MPLASPDYLFHCRKLTHTAIYHIYNSQDPSNAETSPPFPEPWLRIT